MATQDEINSFVEQIMPYFDPTPVEDDAVQQSYPRLDRGLSDAQDMTRFQHLKGIFARGGNPYWLRAHGTNAETDEKRTLFLTVSTITGVAEATMHGAFHRLREDIELSFPAVSTPTTQYVVLEYDPIRSEDGGDPIEAKVVTSLDTSQGKDYLILWEVDRRPSQLLSQASRTRVRPFVAGTVSVNSFDELPDPGQIPFGTLGIVRNDKAIFYAYTPIESGSNSGDPYWASLSTPDFSLRLNGTYESAGVGYAPSTAIVGHQVFLRGAVKLLSGYNFDTGQNGGDGYWFMTLPESQRPAWNMRFITALSGGGSSRPGFATIRIGPDGQVRAFVSKTASWVSLDGISFWAGSV